MSEAANLDVVRKGYEAFGRGDLPGLLALCAADIDWITPGPAELPTAGARKGRDAVAGFFQTLGSLYDFLRFEPKDFIAQGDRVVVLGSDSVRVKATGAVLDESWAHVFTITGGHITRFEEYIDLSAAVEEYRRSLVGKQA